MSNTNNSVVYDVEPLANVEPVPYPEVPEVQEPQTEESAPKKKSAAARIFGALLAALSVAIVAFLQIGVVNGAAVETNSLLTVLKDVFGGNGSKLFNMLPTLADASTPLGVYAGISFYVFALALVLSAIFGLITLFAGKSCLLRTTAFFSAFGFLLYALSLVVVSYVGGALALDVVCLAGAAVALLIYLVLAVAKNGKGAWVNFVQCLFTVAVAAVAIIAVNQFETPFANALGGVAKTLALAIAIALVLDVVIGGIRMQTKKGLTVDMIRYVAQMVIGLVLCYAAITGKAEGNTFLLYSIIVAAVSLVQIIICAIQIKCGKEKVVEEEVVEEPAPVVEEFIREEFAEALPYEGGPVEGVQIAEEVNPTFIAPPPQVQTAGYDFYNCKSFDPFIAILNNEERNQFTELFILKFKGVMPEIPEYVVGGDNKEFFRKMFIYLGQYRDRIPDGLLAKIYQFAIKM